MAPDLLPCGAVARDVAEGALTPEDGANDEVPNRGHGPSCPHCTRLRRQERARWSAVAADLAHREPPPARLRRAVLRRLLTSGRGGSIEASAGARGRTTVAEGVLADLAARAAAGTGGVDDVLGVEVDLTDADAIGVALEVTVALDWARPLPQVAAAIRHAVRVHVGAIAELGVGRIAVTFTDVGSAP